MRLRSVLWLVAVGVAVANLPMIGARATYGARTTADEPQYLLTATSLFDDASLDISDERAAGRYRAYHEVGLPRQEAIQPDGSRVSPHDPLLPALLAIPMGVGGWIAAKATLAALAGALAAAMVWVAVRRFGVRRRVAVLAVVTFAVTAPFAVYGTQVYPELPGALAVTLAVGLLTGPLGRRALLGLGLAIGALPWLSIKYAAVAAALGAVGALRLGRARRRVDLAGLVGGLALAALVFLAAHQAWYGGWSPYAAGSHFTGGEATVIGVAPDYLGRASRVVGLLTDRGFGLAVWQPAFVLLVPAVAALGVRRPRGWDALAVPLAVGWLGASFLALTMHGWWWPGRQLVVVLPLAVLAISWWADGVRAGVPLLVGGLAIGVGTLSWLTAEVFLGQRTLIFDFAETGAPFVRLVRPLLPDLRVDSVASDLGLMLSAGVLAVIGVVGARAWRPRPGSAPVWPHRSEFGAVPPSSPSSSSSSPVLQGELS